MKRFITQYDQVLRAWPQLRGHFREQARVAEAELQAFFDQALPAVTAEVWPTVRQGLVRSELLHQVAPGYVAFGSDPAPAVFTPELAPHWVELWRHLQNQLALPLGCLWSTQWLCPVIPQIPARLIIEVNWAELQWATRQLNASARFCLAGTSSASPGEKDQEIVVLRPFQRTSPIRRVQGLPTARLEKMLVDAGELPGMAAITSDAVLSNAVTSLRAHYKLSPEHLLQYAARCNAGPRWEALLATATAA